MPRGPYTTPAFEQEREWRLSRFISGLNIDFMALGSSKENFRKRCMIIRQIYLELNQEIMQAAKMGSRISPYQLNWNTVWDFGSPEYKTPEFGAWWSIRYYALPFYPQYPVLNSFVDFGDPWLRIALEVDGKQWHDKEKDRARDEQLLEIGWRTFRVTASETKHGKLDFNDLPDMTESEAIGAVEDWLLNTSDGVVCALQALFYNRDPLSAHASSMGLPGSLDSSVADAIYHTLDRHRLIDFPLPYCPSDPDRKMWPGPDD